MSFTINNIGNVNIEHGKAINSNSNVLVANILDTIIEAQNIPVKYAYALVLVIFSNMNNKSFKEYNIILSFGVNLFFPTQKVNLVLNILT